MNYEWRLTPLLRLLAGRGATSPPDAPDATALDTLLLRLRRMNSRRARWR